MTKEIEDNKNEEMEYLTIYNKFLKEKIKEYCNEKGYYELYWDYRESIEPQQLLVAFQNYKKDGYENVQDYLENLLYEQNIDYDVNLFSQIESDLKKQDFFTEKFEKWYKDKCDIQNDLEETGYRGLDVNLKDLLKNSKFNFNIMFATEEEQNRDMTSIFSSFQNLDNMNNFEEKFDNSLTYLLYQQGHTIQEFFECLKENPSGFGNNHKCNFIESTVDEVVNDTLYNMSELTALVNFNGEEAIKFLNYIADNSLEEDINLKFEKETMIGLFDEWQGAGSILEINLENDLIIPKSMIRGIQIEGAENSGYSVDEVYMLTNDCWKNSLSYTDEKPILEEEDINKTKEYLKEYLILEEDEEEDEL